MLDVSENRVAFLIDALRAGARLAQSVQAVPAMAKTDHSPVTVADFGVQALVGRMLRDRFPEDTLVAEEDSTQLGRPEAAETLQEVTRFVGRFFEGAAPRDVREWIDRGGGRPGGAFWTLDPIDGTKGFLRGGQYAVALAYIEGGSVQVGGLACPNLDADCRPAALGEGALIVAARGEGAWATSLADETAPFSPLRVSGDTDPSTARLLRSYVDSHTNAGQLDVIADRLGGGAEPVRLDSQAKYAVLAAGWAELMFRLLSEKQPDYRERIWDQAAGSIAIEEAGGRVTDLEGNPLDFTQGRTLAANRGILASNGALHDAALEAVRAVSGM